MTKNKQTQNVQTGQVWGLRGVDPETRNAVRMAARRSGESIGEFCNRVLYEAASGILKDGTAPPPTSRLEDTLAKLAESLDRQTKAQREQAEATNARLSAIEARTGPREPEGYQGAQNPLARLYGLLRGR